MRTELAAYGVIALKVLLPLLVALTGWLGVKLVQYLDRRIKSAELHDALIQLSNAAITAIKAVEQTYVQNLKATANTVDHRLDARDQALDILVKVLGPNGSAHLHKITGIGNENDFREFLIHTIEAHVHDLNVQQATLGKGV